MSRDGCGIEIEVFVPSGFSGRMIRYKCGQTGVDGYPALCDECEKKFDRGQYRREVEECGERIEEED